MSMSVVGSNVAARAAPAPTDAPASTLATLDDTVTSKPLPPLTDPDKADTPNLRECHFTVASFKHKSNALERDGHLRIDEVMEKIRADNYKVVSVAIVGHMDASEEPADGTDDPDMDMLGLSRASTARSYLSRIYDVRIARIHIEDAGASSPAPSSDAQPQAALNRRVEITLKQRKKSAVQYDDDQNDEDGVVICRLQRAAAVAQCV
ncbi:hypothetical protein [Bordetella sp. LUAb4]|uniref:hypothetical protein n=1 Tax=Bordetella sp. LUAb4 TaxID=2843195 RepID=UPI001E4236CD|nr:hypothetical protein [Bordetella sp. LUAb4]